ncbi:MAG: DUF4349 domain-containing protein [Alphaproteobacteria bacterium]|nr:DUF4349 domain-containing protein [Alphaproteobacteria bacterium]
MRRALAPVLCLCALLAVAACNEESEVSYATASGGSPQTLNSVTMSRSKSVSSDAVNEVSFSAPSTSGATKTIVDRSKLGDRRVAETHNFSIELAARQLQTRVMKDYQTCLSLGCEPMGSNFSSNASGYLNARIAPDKLEAFFTAIESGEGTVKEHSVSVDDETNNYINTSAKLANQTALRDRLTKMLDNPMVKSVSDVMQIEQEMTRVQSEIDSLTGQMKSLEKRTGMATVNVRYNVPYFERGDHYEKLKTSFARAWRGFVDSLDDVIVFIGNALPWLPIVFGGLWLVIKTFRLGFSGSVHFFRRKKKDEVG